MQGPTIKRQYILINTVLLIIVVVALFSIQTLERNYKEEAGKSLKTVSDVVQSAYDVWVDHLKNDVEEVAINPTVVKFAEELLQYPPNSLNLADCEAQLKLREYLKPHLDFQNYVGFFIISIETYISYGSMRNSNIGTKNLIAEAYPELLEKAKNGAFILVPPIISDVKLGTDSTLQNELTMFCGAPIKNSKGEVFAILTFRIDPFKEFTKIAQLGQIGYSGETYAIDLKGVMLTESRFDKDLERIGLIEPNTKSMKNLKIMDPGVNMLNNDSPKVDIDELPLTVAAASVLKKEADFNVIGYNGYLGTQVLGSWVWNEALQLGLITEIDAEEALHSYHKSRNIVLYMLLITVVLVLLLTLIIIRSIRKNRLELLKINEQLEEKVKTRTKELVNKNKELKNAFTKLKNAQSKLIQSEKMASLGKLIAGIAHEINTPIGAIKASIANLNSSVSNIFNEFVFENSEKDLHAKKLIKDLYDATKELKTELSTREKRALRKEFTQELEKAGINQSKEVADILVYIGIRSNLDKLIPRLKRDDLLSILESSKNIASINKNHKTIDLAVDKAGETVFALKKFSYKGDTEEKVQLSVVENIETVLIIYNNILKQGIELETRFEEAPLINGYPDELTQVWTNLIHNATQAMNQKGILKIEVKHVGKKIIVSINDNGPGISKEIGEKIFEPFFTTKSMGEGTGIGLDIVKNIIENHNGKIYFESEIGTGTTFYVELPVQ